MNLQARSYDLWYELEVIDCNCIENKEEVDEANKKYKEIFTEMRGLVLG